MADHEHIVVRAYARFDFMPETGVSKRERAKLYGFRCSIVDEGSNQKAFNAPNCQFFFPFIFFSKCRTYLFTVTV